jgi:probable HAF family extracellular repeat protein
MDLGTLGGRDSMAFGINASGTVVGESYIPDGVPFGPYDVYHAFEYIGTPGMGGSMADLGTLGGSYGVASAINAAGKSLGGPQGPETRTARSCIVARPARAVK